MDDIEAMIADMDANGTANRSPLHDTYFDGLRAWIEGKDIEGIVWHHPDGRMAKLKLRDFGLKRKV